MAVELAPRQAAIYSFLQKYIAKNGLSPTMREVGAAFRIASSSVFQHLQALKLKGWIDWHQRRARSIVLLKPGRASTTIEIPIIGKVAAGLPILAEENFEGAIAIDSGILRSGPHFALRIVGDSMRDAGIMHGDLVVARHQDSANSGDIVVALIGVEATVKRLRQRRKGWSLEPANPAFKAIAVSGPDVKIQGKVVLLHRSVDDSDLFRSKRTLADVEDWRN